jgi:hypothetical protein
VVQLNSGGVQARAKAFAEKIIKSDYEVNIAYNLDELSLFNSLYFKINL